MFSSDDDETLTREGGVARRGLLKCMAWAGTGVVWTMAGGVASSTLLGQAQAATRKTAGLTFVQISDTHIGFDKAANPDTMATLGAAIDHIRAMPTKPAFLLHTGDISHLSKADEFDAADQALKAIGVPIFRTPGEHDTLDEGHGKLFLDRFGAGTKGDGWYSFDHGGVHFVALVNVVNLQPEGRGSLGADQIAWLRDDVAHLSSSTPIVVFAHMPLWDLYGPWGRPLDRLPAARARDRAIAGAAEGSGRTAALGARRARADLEAGAGAARPRRHQPRPTRLTSKSGFHHVAQSACRRPYACRHRRRASPRGHTQDRHGPHLDVRLQPQAAGRRARDDRHLGQ